MMILPYLWFDCSRGASSIFKKKERENFLCTAICLYVCMYVLFGERQAYSCDSSSSPFLSRHTVINLLPFIHIFFLHIKFLHLSKHHFLEGGSRFFPSWLWFLSPQKIQILPSLLYSHFPFLLILAAGGTDFLCPPSLRIL